MFGWYLKTTAAQRAINTNQESAFSKQDYYLQKLDINCEEDEINDLPGVPEDFLEAINPYVYLNVNSQYRRAYVRLLDSHNAEAELNTTQSLVDNVIISEELTETILLNEEDTVLKNAQLFIAIRKNKPKKEKLKKVKKRLREGALINAADANDGHNTPLHIATLKGETEIVELLIKSGANIHIRNDSNETPLDIARKFGIKSVINEIFEETIKSFMYLSHPEEIQWQIPTQSDQIDSIEEEEELFNSNEEDPIEQQRAEHRNWLDTQNSYASIYQLKLLMIFLKRGLDYKYSFRLNTEKNKSKFGNVLFEITDNNAVKEFRLLQAKYVIEDIESIKIDNLLTKTDSDFSLVSYFFCYQQLKSETLLKDGAIKNVTICTNSNFELESTYKSKEGSRNIRLKEIVEIVGDNDHIVDFDNEIITNKIQRYKFSKNIAPLLKPLLEEYSLTRLAIRLVDCLFRCSCICHNDEGDIFGLFHIVLSDRVIDVENRKFFETFVHGLHLDKTTKKFRRIIDKEIRRKSQQSLSLYEINEAIADEDNKGVDLVLSDLFGGGYANTSSWPEVISKTDINNFLNHLVIVTNLPNLNDLSEIVRNELGVEYDFVETDISYNKLYDRVIDWLELEGQSTISYEKGKLFYEKVLGAVWFNVDDPVDNFTGRTSILDELHTLVQRKRELTVMPEMTSISGRAGVGKSELVKKYIHENKSSYDFNVIWIDAGSYLTLVESFRKLCFENLGISAETVDGIEKNIGVLVQEVYNFFSTKKCVFIFDNAAKYRSQHEQDNGIDKFLPLYSLSKVNNKPFFIITSRNHKWGSNVKVLSLNTFSEQETVDFVGKNLSPHSEIELNISKKFLEMMKNFPLALQHSVISIKEMNEEKSFTILDYIQVYEEKENEVELLENMNDVHFGITFKICEITLDIIKANEYGEFAFELFNSIVYFSSNNIQIELFGELIKDQFELNNAVHLLTRYHMIDSANEQNYFRVNNLIGDVIRYRIRVKNEEPLFITKALKIIRRCLHKSQLKIDDIIIHAITVWEYASKYESLVKKFSDVPSQIIRALCGNKRYEDAYLFGVQETRILKNVLGPNNQDTLETLLDLASVLQHQEEYDEALKMYDEVCRAYNNVHGTYHADTLRTRHKIAKVLEQQGNYDYALKLYRHLYSIRKKVFNESHPEVLSTQYNIAKVLTAQEKFDEALDLFNEICDIQSKVLVANHKDTMDTRQKIAEVLLNQGKYKESLTIFEDIFNIRRTSLGNDHKDTLNTQNKIADILKGLGKYDEALKNYEDIFEMQKKHLRKSNPEILSTEYKISEVLQVQGRYDDALSIYRNIFKIRSKFLSSNHPDTLKTQESIAHVLQKQGKFFESLKMYEEVYNIWKTMVIPNHPDVLNIQHSIASVLYDQEKYVDALKMFEEVLVGRKRILSLNHADTLSSQYNIAKILQIQGKYDKALQTFEEVYELQSKILPANHPDTLTTQHSIAVILQNQGEYSKALKIFHKVLKMRKTILLRHHSDTLATRHNIAIILQSQGKFEDALKIFEKVLKTQKKIFSPNHPDILSTKYNMAVLHTNKGNFDEALRIYDEIFYIRKTVLAPNHPDTLITQHNMAVIFEKQNKYDEALKIFKEISSKQQDILEAHHPHTLLTQHNIATILQNQGKYKEAFRLYKEIFNIQKKCLAPSHPIYLRTLYNIPIVLQNQGKYSQAIKIYEEFLRIQKRTLVSNHPDMLLTQYNIATILLNQGKYDECLKIYEEVLGLQKSMLPSDHPDVLSTQHNIAVGLQNQGKMAEALKLYTDIFKTQKERLDSNHPDILMIKHNIESILQNQRQGSTTNLKDGK